ncbi:PREDICTED: uncharacterized protein LOC105153212 isoform X2 [Acromyrmex echinatior]|uniref:uncharacterized protein LOC105153212 isoform X2 n=1 Tax=Acromyrmex echinatior TaxID=103372 RepID=UPI000580BC5D|nr:PREDICTED: uncharacterized protein LOC105153212 isoform X2 [Acromyrmex echinatior]
MTFATSKNIRASPENTSTTTFLSHFRYRFRAISVAAVNSLCERMTRSTNTGRRKCRAAYVSVYMKKLRQWNINSLILQKVSEGTKLIFV